MVKTCIIKHIIPALPSDNTHMNNGSELQFYGRVRSIENGQSIIGIDYDSFEKLGGDGSFQKAWKILNESQNSGYKGWDQFGSKQNRYWICENFINPKFTPVREAIYNYHLNGLDTFHSNPEESRKIILDNLKKINDVNTKNFNSSILNLFINAKSDEITNMFKEAKLSDKRNVYNVMMELSPSNSDLFIKILE